MQHRSISSPYRILFSLLVLVVPMSTNYQLNELNLNSGGGVGQSTNYGAEQSFGEVSSPLMSGTTYAGGLGFGFTQMSNVPVAPSLTNPSNYYNKLHLVINPGTSASDTTFALAISSDGFVTTQYVKSDMTVGSSLALNDYLTYSGWSSSTGTDIIGLTPGTTYAIKAKARQGNFTESGYGPTASAATVTPNLNFEIDVSPIDQSTSPPYVTNLGSLPAGSVVTSTDKIWISLDTNAAGGGKAYLSAASGGLRSTAANYTINSATGDLSALAQGFGAQGSSVAQTSGGPLTLASPYNGSANTIGITDNSIRDLFTSNVPIVAGRGSFVLKAKSKALTPAAVDYSETLTVIASASF